MAELFCADYAPKDSSNELKLKSLPQIGSKEFEAFSRSLDERLFTYKVIKRAFDFLFSCLVVIIGFIPCLALSAAIAIDTKGSPIYSQIRVGKYGKPFRIFKFRSMIADSDNVEKYLSDEQLAQWRRERKVDDDPRITRLGLVIRNISLDELPQFLNVLCGQMSIIGPRPISYDEIGEFGNDAAKFCSVPGGITGAWQAGPRNNASFESGERQVIELEYAQRASVKEDARIFFATFAAMFGKARTGR